MIRHHFVPRLFFALVATLAGTSLAVAQEPLAAPLKKLAPTPIDAAGPPFMLDNGGPNQFNFASPGNGSSYLAGNTQFPNFIGFLSNPIQSIDPRAVTELWPMFGAGWVSANKSILPSGNLQVYGAGLNVAVSDRLSFGLNQGGYAVANFANDRETLRARLGLPVRDIDRGGEREGWLNLGGFVQYTLIADVPNQFLLSAGLRVEAPAGSTQLFQGGANPAYLSPYLTMGKELGSFHFLATTGYEFPAGSGAAATTNTCYLNLHLDRKIGWFYPLIELNGARRTTNADIGFATPRHGVIDLGTFTTTGNSLTGAYGANAVLIPGKLEIGAVYVRPLSAQNNFDASGMILKMVYRY